MKKITTMDGRTLVRRSRWIQVRNNYNPNKRNALWCYVRDGYGYSEGQEGYDPSRGLFLGYFRWNGRNWAINQFVLLGGMMGGVPYFYKDEDGKTCAIGAYDVENYFNPILLEMDEYGEYVRVYEEV